MSSTTPDESLTLQLTSDARVQYTTYLIATNIVCLLVDLFIMGNFSHSGRFLGALLAADLQYSYYLVKCMNPRTYSITLYKNGIRVKLGFNNLFYDWGTVNGITVINDSRFKIAFEPGSYHPNFVFNNQLMGLSSQEVGALFEKWKSDSLQPESCCK